MLNEKKSKVKEGLEKVGRFLDKVFRKKGTAEVVPASNPAPAEVDVVKVTNVKAEPSLDTEKVRRLEAEKEEKLRQSEKNYQIRKAARLLVEKNDQIRKATQSLVERDKQRKVYAAKKAKIKFPKPSSWSSRHPVLVDVLKTAAVAIPAFLTMSIVLAATVVAALYLSGMAGVMAVVGFCATVALGPILAYLGSLGVIKVMSDIVNPPATVYPGATSISNSKNRHRSEHQSTASLLRQRVALDRVLDKPESTVKYRDEKTGAVRMFSRTAAIHRARALQLASENVEPVRNSIS